MVFALAVASNPNDPAPAVDFMLWVALATKIASLALLGYFAKKCFERLHTEMQNQPPAVDTSWGGLGGGLGGWTASKSLVWLILTLLTLLSFVTVAVQLSDGLTPQPKQAVAAEQKKEAEKGSTGSSPSEAKSEPAKSEPAKTDAKTDSAGKKDEPKSEPTKNK